MFKIVEVKDMSTVMDFVMEGTKKEDVGPFIKALVFENEEKENNDSRYMSCEILKVIDYDEKLTYGKKHEFGDYASFRKDLTTIVKDEKDFSKEELDDAVAWREKFDTYHKSTPYKVYGSFFDDKPMFDGWDKAHTFPRYGHVDDIEITCPPYVDSLDKAELWLINNYPEYYMGCTISQACRGGNFLATAIPCTEYPKGSYETYQGRIDYAANKAKELYKKIPESEREKFSDKVGLIRHDMTGRALPESELLLYQKTYWAEKRAETYEKGDEVTREKSNEAKIPGKKKPELHLDKNYIIIWQRDPKDEFNFVSADRLKERGMDIKRDDFEPVYVCSRDRVQSLDDVYDLFQNDTPGTPEDYHSRSLSVGDVITLNANGKESSYFVDTFGFNKVPEFTKGLYLVNGVIHDKTSLSRLEADILEDQYGMDIDGNEKIGKDALATDIGDRDRDGTGIADKYDKADDYDEYPAR